MAHVDPRMCINPDCCALDVDDEGPYQVCVASHRQMLRGTAAGLEFVFGERSFDVSARDIAARLEERPDFYRGSRAVAIFEGEPPPDDAIRGFAQTVGSLGIVLRGIYGTSDARELAGRIALPYLGEPPRPSVANIARKRAARAGRGAEFTPESRSLDADFAGARADIASRRARGEASVARPKFDAAARAAAAAVLGGGAPAASPPTLYHRGTLRGGRALQQVGTVVVVGDVNPGAELVASGDIVVFGALRGTAHAGAQGDATARVYALDLAPTQLRIATFIASGDGAAGGREPEVAFVRDGRIATASIGTAEFGR